MLESLSSDQSNSIYYCEQSSSNVMHNFLWELLLIGYTGLGWSGEYNTIIPVANEHP